MADRFFLDPDYAHNQASALKRSTLGTFDLSSALLVLLVLIFPFAAMVLFSRDLMGRIATDRAYLAEGREMTASVTACEMVSGRNSRRPRITYSYRVDNQTFEGEQLGSSSGASCEQYSAGATFMVLYLASNPHESRVVDARVANAVWLTVVGYVLMGFTGLVCGFISLAMLFGITEGVRMSLRYERLTHKGVIVEGELVEVKTELIGRYGRDHNINVTYRFQAPDGRTLTRKQSNIRNDLRSAKPPPLGSPVSVFYADEDAVVLL